MILLESQSLKPSRYKIATVNWLAAILILVLTSGLASCQSHSDVDWLTKALKLKKGSVVADVGAGSGDQSIAIARYVGPEGTVYSTELGAGSVRRLRSAIERAGVDNVTVVEGQTKQTNLPGECCDAIYMRRVYHHITDPPAFNQSLLQSLKPGGRLAVIDFEPNGGEAPPGRRASGGSHGVTLETVVKELREAGFNIIKSQKGNGRNIYVVAEKPTK